MKKLLILFIMLSLVLTTGCETTGRKNGSNSEHNIVRLKNVNISGSLTIGGAEQLTEDAAQEGLGLGAKNDIKAEVEADGNTITPVP